MRLIDADMIPLCLITEGQDNPTKYGFKPGDTIRFRPSEVDAIVRKMPTIEERKSTIEFPHVFIAEGYDSIKSEDGETGFGIYDPENKQIFIAGSVPNEIFVKALLHELMHWVQDISGCAFNEGEANTFAENIYNTMESYIVTGRWIPCGERLPENGKQVLVYARSVHYALAKYDEMREADGTYKKQWVTFDAWKPFYTIKEVIAWMPLPEPYREDGEE